MVSPTPPAYAPPRRPTPRPRRPARRANRRPYQRKHTPPTGAHHRLQYQARRTALRRRSEARLLLVAVGFLLAFGALGWRMVSLATAVLVEVQTSPPGAVILNTRADITDRHGRVLATNFATNALYAHPRDIIDPRAAAQGLANIFPDFDADTLYDRFTSDRRFLWLRRSLSPEQEQMVHDLGEPGLLFGPRDMRLYPNGPVAAHALGGAGFGQEAVNAAEIIGIAGIEAQFDQPLRDPGRGGPLALSLDLTVQATVEEVLAGGMMLMNARGAAAVLMDVHTGEVHALASLPDFDPNARPNPNTEGSQADSPLFNRAVQGVYELGSVFKTFTIAQALDMGIVTPYDMVDTRGPLEIAGFAIRDFHSRGPEQSVRDVLIHSSNIGSSRIALAIGAERQSEFLARLGLLSATNFEVIEAAAARPLWPGRWGELSAMTVSYGHGISVSPLHLAAAYAAIVNGGTAITPTLMRQAEPQNGPRVISAQTSAQMRDLLRAVVTEGSASFANVPGYAIGGKTGTADLPRASGGYYDERNVTTFASAFPMDDPRYVLIVMLQEPVETSGAQDRRTAGWTAVPVAAEIIRRIAPLLGLAPSIASATVGDISDTPQ